MLLALLALSLQAIAFTEDASADAKLISPPDLMEKLRWLSGAFEEESGDGENHHTFESDAAAPCSVTITETRLSAKSGFWIKMAFSLADIDPQDIR